MTWRRYAHVSARDARGFTLIELLVAMAIIGILAAIAVQQFESLSSKSRIARAQSDTKAIGTAVMVFNTHMGAMPTALADLTTPATNTAGVTAGPFLGAVPNPPGVAWTPYGYTLLPNGTFQITATGDGVTVSWP